MTKWGVTIQLFFTRTNFDYTIMNEPNPTQKQFDAYMRKGSKYKFFLKDMYGYGVYGQIPSKIKYIDGGKLSYELDKSINDYQGKSVFPTVDSIKEDIMNNSFEDGMYQLTVPSHGVYPTKKKYLPIYGTESVYEELGVIDCRTRASISVQKL